VAEAVKAVPGVARLSPGTQVEVATQYAGGKVIGVGLSAEVVFVHVVVDLLPVAPVAEAVRSAAATALASLGDRRRVEVVVEDLDLVDGRLPMSYRDLR
jgi:hypothetical protein